MCGKQYLLLNKQRKAMGDCLSVGGTWRAIPSVLNETVLSDQSFKSYQNQIALLGIFYGNFKIEVSGFQFFCKVVLTESSP